MQVQRINGIDRNGNGDVRLTLACSHQPVVKNREYALRIAPLGTYECIECPTPEPPPAPSMREDVVLMGMLRTRLTEIYTDPELELVTVVPTTDVAGVKSFLVYSWQRPRG